MDLVFSFFGGMVTIIAYILYRMMRNDGWDDSNITNAIRLLSHVTLHAEDFGKMYYLTDSHLDRLASGGVGSDPKRPFWYVGEDEFKGVVRTRP